MSETVFTITLTDEQRRRIATGETVTIVPAKEDHQIRLTEQDYALAAEYVPTRTRDHCTAEERAVIDLALQYHELRLMQSGTTRTLATLVAAVDALLAARKEQE